MKIKFSAYSFLFCSALLTQASFAATQKCVSFTNYVSGDGILCIVGTPGKEVHGGMRSYNGQTKKVTVYIYECSNSTTSSCSGYKAKYSITAPSNGNAYISTRYTKINSSKYYRARFSSNDDVFYDIELGNLNL